MPDARRLRFVPTCLGAHFFARAAEDAVLLLRSLGAEVEVVRDVACCGQPAWNAGHVREARSVATRWWRVLGDDPRPVVLPSGSCAAMARHAIPRLLDDGPGDGMPGRAAPRSAPIYELAEYLVDVLDVGGGEGAAFPDGLDGVRVAYHHGCHALRELAVREAPLRLLEAAGATLVEWPAAEECCGFGGLFAVKLPHVSAAMADRKLDALGGSGPVDVLTSADGGCLMQLGGRMQVRRSGPSPRVVHLATLLREARGNA